jgi:hypothetical protein
MVICLVNDPRLSTLYVHIFKCQREGTPSMNMGLALNIRHRLASGYADGHLCR